MRVCGSRCVLRPPSRVARAAGRGSVNRGKSEVGTTRSGEGWGRAKRTRVRRTREWGWVVGPEPGVGGAGVIAGGPIGCSLVRSVIDRAARCRAAPGSLLGHGPRAQVLAVAADFAAAAAAATEPGIARRPR